MDGEVGSGCMVTSCGWWCGGSKVEKMVNRDVVSCRCRNLGERRHWQMSMEVMATMNGAWQWVSKMVLELKIVEIGYIYKLQW